MLYVKRVTVQYMVVSAVLEKGGDGLSRNRGGACRLTGSEAAGILFRTAAASAGVLFFQIQNHTFAQQRVQQVFQGTGHPGALHHVPDQETVIPIDKL